MRLSPVIVPEKRGLPGFLRASTAWRESNGLIVPTNRPRFETGYFEMGSRNDLDANKASAETDLTGWAASAGVTLTRVDTWSKHGSWSVQVENATDSSTYGSVRTDLVTGITYVGSATVKNPTAGSITVSIGIAGGGGMRSYTLVAGEERRIYTNGWTSTITSLSTLRFWEASGLTFNVDAVQFEIDYLSPFRMPNAQGILGRGALRIDEGMTNLVTEIMSSFEAGITGWAGTNATVSHDTTTSKFGKGSLKCVTNNSVTAEGAYMSTLADVTDSLTYTASVWIKGSGTVTIRIREFDAATATIGDTLSSAVTLTNEWQRLTVTRTFGASGVKASIQVRTNSTQAATFNLDGAQIEQKAYATSWHIGGGTRAAETLTFPASEVALAAQGTVSCWVKLDAINGVDLQIAVDVAGTGITGCILMITTSGAPRFQYGTGASTTFLAATTILTAGIWYLIAGRWSASGGAVFVNGVNENSSANAPGISVPTTGYIGTNLGTQRYLNGVISDVRISNTALTDAEIVELYASGVPATVDANTTYKPNLSRLPQRIAI
jgi:hypothetical protein